MTLNLIAKIFESFSDPIAAGRMPVRTRIARAEIALSQQIRPGTLLGERRFAQSKSRRKKTSDESQTQLQEIPLLLIEISN
jgi:hypothetical protein